MNQIPSNPLIHSTSSIFDLLETFHTELHRLRQQTHSINTALNSYIQNARTQDPHQFHTIVSNLGLSSEDLSQMAHIDSRFHRINDIIEDMTQAHFQEQMALSSKYEQELAEYRKELSLQRETNIEFRTNYEQEKIHWQLEKQALEEKALGLSKELAESRSALVENVTTSANEEKVNKKKMEMWFKSRLDSIEHHIVELKEAPHDEKKFEHLLKKVRGLKKKQPWNMDRKRPNLVLDDAALNQRSEVYSNGTSTPYSHYVGVLSSAATENNLLDKGFVCSVDSFPATQKSQTSFLSEVPSSGMKNTKQRLLESAVRKLHDSHVSFSEKERLFCDMFRGTPGGNDALMHVKLDDILNAANVSKSIDSLSLDLKSNGKPKYTFVFNQKLRLDELKDTKLEKAISTIQSQGSQKSSERFGTFKRSKSLDGNKLTQPNLEQLMELNMTDGDKQEISAALDQGIIQELSGIPDNFLCKDTEKSLGLLLAEANTLKLDQNIMQGTGQNRRENKKAIFNSKFNERLISESSFVDDEFRHFLKKPSEDLDLSKSFKRSSKDMKFFGQSMKIDRSREPDVTHNTLERLLNNLELIPQRVVRASNGNMAASEHMETIKVSKEEEEGKVTPPAKANKGMGVPMLNFNVFKENAKKEAIPAEEKITAVNSKADTEPKENINIEDYDSATKRTAKHSEKHPTTTVTSTEEKPPLQPQILPKTPKNKNQRQIEETQHSDLAKKAYNPRISVDSAFMRQLQPVQEVKRRIHPRPKFSSQDMSLDADFQLSYQEHDANQKSDHKNLSFSIEQEQKFVQPPKIQFQTKMNSLLGRNTHTRQKTVDVIPPQKVQSQSHFIRSSFAQNHSQYSPHSGIHASSSVLNSSNSQFNISLPSSQNSTQEAKFAQLIGSTGLNLLKKVLPSENSKRYPTPVKLNYRELSKKTTNENLDPAPGGFGGQSYSLSKDLSTEKKDKRLRPTSPTRSMLHQAVEGKLGGVVPRKQKKGDDRDKVPHISASGATGSGSNQFRARMFAPKKV